MDGFENQMEMKYFKNDINFILLGIFLGKDCHIGCQNISFCYDQREKPNETKYVSKK